MAAHRFEKSRTKRPVEVGLRVLEHKYLYIGPPNEYSPPLRRGELQGIAADRIYILWDDDTEPTIHHRKELLAWDASIASYRQHSATVTVVTLFEED